ncbi:hypothetical protein PsorP6_011608 [Peronosclerospora sorghi]|uniref:Uncharacterized protein n=1 Tax=Peronosclerospora sorghi TaxID=230839 RepID=A0ACC0WKK3_9STRA|nr:hypothetical protein PsorP6_011608 [Peronosclerospora sorghi]
MLVYIKENEPRRAEKIAMMYGIPNWTHNPSDVLSHPEVDAVIICSPTDKHAEQIIEAAKNKKHIFCEKPVDLNLEIVDKAINATKDAGVKLMIGFQRRFDANFVRIKQAIDHDEIGKVHMIRITSLDEVYAMTQSVNPDIAAAGDIDTAVVLLKFRNGVICSIENSREAAYGYDQRVEVLGSKGSAACDNKHSNQVVVSTNECVRRDLPLHFFLERYMDAYVAEMEAFIRLCITDGASAPVSGEDGREALLLALAANKSMAENRPVKVDELRYRSLKYDSVEHRTEALDSIESHEVVNIVLQMFLGVQFTNIQYFEFFRRLLFFLLNSLVILPRERQHSLRRRVHH